MWFFKQDQFLTIERFQLENILSQHLRFEFFDLRRPSQAKLSQDIESLLNSAQRLTPAAVIEKLQDQERELPIVLICERGRTSRRVARRLTQLGFNNLVIVNGGVRGLASKS